MKKSGTPTKYPGVSKIAEKTYRVRGKVIDPRTGKPKEVDRIIENVSVQEAARVRAELLEALRSASVAPEAKRLRVGEYAQLWMQSKTVKIDSATADKYSYALDHHILPALGDYYYDALTRRDVQDWVDRALTSGWSTRSKRQKPYKVDTVYAWYRVLRNMTRDALDELGLERDPTMRISFPDRPLVTEPKSLAPAEVSRFLAEVRERYPQHFALTVILMFTGLRFCHASALKWEDWDDGAGAIRVVRKQVKGVVGRISRKKRGPGEYPVEPELAEILRQHRRDLLRQQNPGLAAGWMFPTQRGTLRGRGALDKAWKVCLKAAGITRRFTIHGARYTFTDLTRRANVDAVVRRALVGHVTEAMQQHYSHVALDEKRAAVAGVHRLVPLAAELKPASGDLGGDSSTEG